MRPPICDKTAPPHLENPGSATVDGNVACKQTLTFFRADVQITDLEDFIPLIELNVKQNEAALRGKAEAKTLKWGEDMERFLPPPDYILFADCIYYEEVRSLRAHLQKAKANAKSKTFCQWRIRDFLEGRGAPTMKGRRRGEAPTYYWDNYEEMKKIGQRGKIVEGSFTLGEGERESEISLSVTDPGFLRGEGASTADHKGEAPTYYSVKIFWKLHENKENWAERRRGSSRQKFVNVDSPLCSFTLSESESENFLWSWCE